MQDAKVKIKTVILIDEQVFTSTSEGSSIFECAEVSRHGAIQDFIKQKFDEVRPDCRSDNDAVLETAVLLGISERSVYRYVKGY